MERRWLGTEYFVSFFRSLCDRENTQEELDKVPIQVDSYTKRMHLYSNFVLLFTTAGKSTHGPSRNSRIFANCSARHRCGQGKYVMDRTPSGRDRHMAERESSSPDTCFYRCSHGRANNWKFIINHGNDRNYNNWGAFWIGRAAPLLRDFYLGGLIPSRMDAGSIILDSSLVVHHCQ